jgi:hypothetical protein
MDKAHDRTILSARLAPRAVVAGSVANARILRSTGDQIVHVMGDQIVREVMAALPQQHAENVEVTVRVMVARTVRLMGAQAHRLWMACCCHSSPYNGS